jgi:hypothetical protein
MKEQPNKDKDATEEKPNKVAKALPKSILEGLTDKTSESDLAEQNDLAEQSDLAEQFYTVATTCW